ncbi:hypothetical protein N7517_003568 [Penicillium concentricum]|uniref:Uncharacterized protein n=1 Tax=Penicillium concentricum TaxID=293559 RepID=A0A9W9V7F2_9EURO|nr:uncharacterized protein N7517_003568 [Penicillium concentricum]KAJ5371562.1 hypothetical protein N7517_003568 [Penicillium concentricum]
MSIPSLPSEHPNQLLRNLGAQYDPDLPISLAFRLAGAQRGWKPGSKTWKRNWNSCMDSEYDRLIGCRALARVHVNLVDVLDAWNSDVTPTQFKSKEALAKYTKESQKFFGRQLAKQDKALRVLLRKLL